MHQPASQLAASPDGLASVRGQFVAQKQQVRRGEAESEDDGHEASLEKDEKDKKPPGERGTEPGEFGAG